MSIISLRDKPPLIHHLHRDLAAGMPGFDHGMSLLNLTQRNDRRDVRLELPFLHHLRSFGQHLADRGRRADHALAHAINQALGNVGKTVIYTDPIDANPMDQNAGLRELVNDMGAGKVDMLVIAEANLAASQIQ